MKNIFTKFISALAFLGVALSLAGCVEEMPDVNEELMLDRYLTPTEFTANVDPTDGVTVTFKWKGSKGASDYVIQIFEGKEDDDPNQVFNGTSQKLIESKETSAKIKLASDKFYFARIKAMNPDSEILDSKWLACTKVLATYEVKSSLYPSLVRRTDNSITVMWNQADADLINQIRVSPNPDLNEGETGSDYKVYPVTGVYEGSDKSFTVDGLKPSVKYTVAIHYKSANRGEVYAWTRPSLSNPTRVATTEAFKQALADHAAVIELTNPDTPYEISEAEGDGLTPVTLTYPADASLEIYGRSAENGTKPTVIGAFKLPDMENVKVEDIKFLGTNDAGAIAGRVFEVIGSKLASLEMFNCEVGEYNCGLFYMNTAGEKVGKIKFDNIYMYDIWGNGGDCIDIRKSNIGDITVTNSTIHNSTRNFLRIDKDITAGNIKVEHNTFNAVSCGQYANNKGIFYLRAKSYESLTISKNLFLNIVNASTPANAIFMTTLTAKDGVQDSAGPNAGELATFKANYFFKVGNAFWMKETKKEDGQDVTLNPEGKGHVTQTQATAGAGAIISADPCENSAEAVFYLKPTSEAYQEGIGDPRWLENYVPVVEPTVLTTPVEYGKVWNLADTKTFGKTVKKDLIRDELRFFVTNTIFNVLEDGLEFTGSGVVKATGVPEDGAIAFRVKGPGSVLLSVAKSRTGDINDHLTVALGDVEGNSAEVMGSAFVGGEKVKIAFPTLAEDDERLVYLYPCGPVILTAMQWTDDVNTGGPAVLATPELALDQAEVDDTYTGKVTLSWQEVASAASYEVTMKNIALGDDATIVKTVTTNSYEIDPSEIGLGTWTITVQAFPSSTDMSKEPSEVSDAVEFTINETLKPVSGSNVTVWEDANFRKLIASKGTGDVQDEFISDNLRYITGGGKFKFGENEVTLNDLKQKYARVQLGGTGTPGEKASLQFIVPGPGTLTVVAVAGGDETSKARVLAAAVGSDEVGTMDMPLLREDGPVTAEFDCSSATAGSLINIYSKNKGINIFTITWTPSGANPGAGIPADETAINETTSLDWSTLSGDITTEVQAGKFTLVGTEDKKITIDGTKRIKFNGSSSVDSETGLPTARYISFKITKPGTLTHKVISSSSSADTRPVDIVLAKQVDGQLQTVTLYNSYAPTSSSADAIDTEITSEHLSGTNETVTIYVFGSDGAVNVHELKFAPAE